MPKVKIFGFLLALGLVLSVGLVLLGRESEVRVGIGDYQTGAATQTAPHALPQLIPEERNFSDNFAKIFAEQLLIQNPTGPSAVEGESTITLRPQELIDGMLGSAISAQQAEMAVVNEITLKVVPQTAESEKEYFLDVRDAINNALGGFPQEDLIKLYQASIVTNDYGEMLDFYRRIDKAFVVFKNMPVPNDWMSNHKKSLELLARGRMIAKNFVVWQEDPMRALIALNLYPKFSEDVRNLTNTYARNFERVGI